MTIQKKKAETANLPKAGRVSSPTATGGAGTFFEQHVAAYWLAQLLVRGIPPILNKTTVTEVHFQTKHLGWQTDDFLIVCERTGAAPQKLAGQVKLSFTVSAADQECKKAFLDFWKDFKSPDHFSQADDRLVLVTLLGTNTLLMHFAGLLDCARAARNGSEFEYRLNTEGFISKKAINYCGEFQKIITDYEGQPITKADIWPFLRVLHVLSLDLDTSTRQTEANIKSLLAHMAAEGDATSAAEATWNALLEIASTAMPEARSLCRADLPGELQQRHSSLSTNEQHILHAFKNHTDPILRGIRTTIGQECHLQRAGLVQKILGKLEAAQVVIVSGPSGIGKSAIGKAAVSILSQDHFVFGFRAEEFARPHFDETLQAAQVQASWAKLRAILAGQNRKVVLVESVERLLEKTTRDAFSDLMTIIAADHSMRVILTCRDYSIDQVRVSFLLPVGIEHAIVSVPFLEEEELKEVETAYPSLAYPLKNQSLRNILRNPYFLDKALDISWSAERPLPKSEREFRALFWQQIVRADHRVPPGMDRQREEVFQNVAVRRARALSPYVTCNDLDPAVVAALRHDSLIVSPDGKPLLVATSHDVLEDWAILQWIEDQHFTDEGSFKELSAAIGTHPAIRRCYRKWVADLIERDRPAADRLFEAAIHETEITAQFRDDTLVSLLKAPLSPDFLQRHEAQLMANDKALLKLVIQLLRVACMKIPIPLQDRAVYGWLLNVPEGPAWTTVLSIVHHNIVHHNIDSFTQQEYPLLIDFIEDAVRKVSWWAPEPGGAEFIAGIGYWLLTHFDNYRSEKTRKRLLKVIAKIPKADPARFEVVLSSTVKAGQRRDPIADDFRKMIFSGLEGIPAARDLPDLVVAVAADYLLASKKDLQKDSFYGSPIDLEMNFGIKEGRRGDYFPPSALRGPWFYLLWYHPRQTLDFFIKVFNHSTDWYIHPRVHDRLEPAWEIELTFADGTTQKQWGNQRFWNLYRGTSVGPYVLQCMLMALERCLLELAGKFSDKLDAILVDTLHRSDSAMIAAVVASVATAYPRLAGEALLVLLSAPDYIRFDRTRMATEAQASSLSVFPTFQAENKIYQAERKEANQLAHRKLDLEAAITNLQLGPFASRVHNILDRYLTALPPKSKQDESDLKWRLALHRMDFRQYTITETNGLETIEAETNSDESVKRYVRLEPKAADSDVQAMVDDYDAQYSVMNARLGVLMWGLQIFNRETGNYDPSQWRQKLDEARTMDREAEQNDGSRNGPGFVAAVCVRDHWDEMSTDEQGWCVEVVCSEILRQSDQWDYDRRIQRFSMAADRPGASVVSILLSKPLAEPQMELVRTAFAVALTHPIEEVRWYSMWGIDRQFWTTNPEVALRCVNAIATEAALIDQAWEFERSKPYRERCSLDEICAEMAIIIRKRFWQKGAIAEDSHNAMDISNGFRAAANVGILSILRQIPNDPKAIAAFERASCKLVDWWDAENRNSRNYETEASISNCLQQFLMRTNKESALKVLRPILDAIDRNPHEIHSIIQGLTAIEDSRPNTPQFWFLWGVFADAIKVANWVSRLNDERSDGQEMVSAIFLTAWWKDNVRHWKSLEGYAHHVHALFEALPPSSIVLGAYMRFLYHIGEQSLPEAFVRVANSLKIVDVQTMLRNTDKVFLLEVLLHRNVYGRPLELKKDPNVRGAVLFLLDILVENGSSAAFRMRDDFVTPRPS